MNRFGMNGFWSRRNLTLLSAVLGLSAASPLQATTKTWDFNTDPSAEVTFDSTPVAKWVDTGGVTGGYISITDAVNGLTGTVLFPDIDAGAAVTGFKLNLKLRIGGGTARPADGMSINWIPAGGDTSFPDAETGVGGASLTLSLDTWDNNGGDSAPAAEIRNQGSIRGIAFSQGQREGGRAPFGASTFDLQTGANFVDVEVLYRDSFATVKYNNVTIIEGAYAPTTSEARQIFMGARTGGANEAHWIDDMTLTSYTPEASYVTRVAPNPIQQQPNMYEYNEAYDSMIFPSDTVQVDIVDGTTAPLNNGSVVVKFDGATVTPTFAKTDTTTTVTYDPPGDMALGSHHTVEVTFGTGVGSETSTIKYEFDVQWVPNTALFIESEDWNHGSGQFVAGGNSGQYPGGAWEGLVGVHDTDYHDNGNPEEDNYRTGDDPNRGIVPADGLNSVDARRAGWTVTKGYKVGWNDPGEWSNYTRDFPPSGYEVYGRFASGGAENFLSLSIVEGATTTEQSTVELGTFRKPPSNGWDTFRTVPLLDSAGQPVKVRLAGVKTVRVTTIGGNNDQNYIFFVPTTGVIPAKVGISPGEAAVVPSDADFTITGTILDQGTAVAASSVKLTINGVQSTAVATKSGDVSSISQTVTAPGLGKTFVVRVDYIEGTEAKFKQVIFFSSGAAYYKRYEGIGGTAVGALYTAQNYIDDLPDDVQLVPLFEAPLNIAANYGAVLLAYFTPDASADHVFTASADDGLELYLSTDEHPLNKRRIAHNNGGWNSSRNWTGDESGNFAPRVSAPIFLEQGKKYFIQGVFKEGGGGDNFAVAVRRPGQPALINGDPPIGHEITPFEIGIDQNPPASVTVSQGAPVTLSARIISGPPGLTLQWLKNGQPIAGATSGQYTFNSALTDSGAKYSLRGTVQIDGVDRTVTTTETTLTVSPDNTNPAVASAYARTFTDVYVNFSEPVPTVASFTINGSITVASFVASQGGIQTYHLKTSKLTEGQQYTVTANNFTDYAGRNTASGSANFTLAFTPGFALAEFYTGIGGNTTADLTGAASYPEHPSEVRFVANFETPTGYADNYGSRLSGYFVPPRTGDVQFFISADDGAGLYLSTDEDPANVQLIATEPVWNGVRDWTGTARRNPDAPENRSALIPVVAGKKYYIEQLQKEGGGGDNSAATYIYDGEPLPTASSILSGKSIQVSADPTGRSVTITQQPANPGQIQDRRTTTFSVQATALPAGAPIAYQWQRKGATDAAFADIPNAQANVYTTGALSPAADDNAQYRVIVYTIGVQQISDVVTLDVIPDTFPPNPVAGSLVHKGVIEIAVSFDEPVVEAEAGVQANYSISPGTITGFRVIPNNKVAVLTTSGLTVGQNVNVTVKNVKEAFNPANAINGTTGATVAHTISGRKWAAVGGQEAGFTPDAAGMGGSAATGWNYDVVSGGIGFWDVYDEGTFVYDDITGDFDKAVRVEYQDPSSHWARCGLMVREALDEDKPRAAGGMSRYQQIFVDPTTKYDGTAANNAHEFNQRLTAGGATTGATVSGPNGPPPYPNAWIRMKREGSQITMYRGNDGVNWTQMAQMTFSPDLAATAAVGLIYSPENANIPVDSGLRAAYMAKFRNYKDIGTIVTPIRITITKSAGGVTISWTGDNGLGKLYSSATADGVFTEVVGATNGGEQPAATGDRFYLIRRP
jgi:hypothetical protein